MLTALTASTRWTWITGNHDPGFADHCGGSIVEEAEVDGLFLRHEADPARPRPELSGHFHPKLRIHHRGRQVSRRCFVATRAKLILPAFGSLTGGLDAGHPEIVRAVGRKAEALVPVADRLLQVPAGGVAATVRHRKVRRRGLWVRSSDAAHELQRHAVDAPAFAGGGRTVVEDMAEMAAAAAAMDLDAAHAPGVVAARCDSIGNGPNEARPAGAAVELVARGEERKGAAGAEEGASSLLTVERARAGALGRGLAKHAILSRGEARGAIPRR